MNICFLKMDMTIKGGSERVASLLMNELVKEKSNNIYSVSINRKNSQCAYSLDGRIEEIYLTNDGKRMRYKYFKILSEFRKFLKSNKINLILCIGMAGSTIGILSKIGLNIKIICCEHSNLLNFCDNGYQQKLAQWLSAKFADKVITLTEKDTLNYKKKFNIIPKRIEYIYNFIDEKLLNLKSNYDVESKKIISVGRLVKVKGFDRLVEIAKIVFEDKRTKDWVWHIYGEGPERERLKQLIKKYNLEKKVILKGNVENIYELYKEYSFYIMTSYFEGLPMVLLEAKANSLPIISFDINTGPSEIIRDNVDGYLIKDGDIEKMKNKILELIINKNIRKKFTLNSRENLYKFDRKEILQKWKKLLGEIYENK